MKEPKALTDLKKLKEKQKSLQDDIQKKEDELGNHIFGLILKHPYTKKNGIEETTKSIIDYLDTIS